MALRKPHCQITTLHSFIMQGQRGKDILTRKSLSSIPSKSPVTGQGPRGTTAKECFQLGITGESSHCGQGPLSTAETRRAPQFLKARVNFPPTKVHWDCNAPSTENARGPFLFSFKLGGCEVRGKQKPETAECCVTAKADAGFHCGNDPSRSASQ